MYKSLILLPLALLIGCGGGRQTPATPSEIASKAPVVAVLNVGDTLVAAPCDTLHLGRMRSGEVVEMGIGIHNIAEQPLVITRTETTCGCTDIDYPTRPINVGDTAHVAISFDSQGFFGWQFKRVRLYTSADMRPITFYIEAEVE